jgi:hypothetical protein
MLDLDIAAIAVADIPAALTQLAAYQAQLAARLMVPAEPVDDGDDLLLTTEEAAKLLRRSTKWISRHRRSLPFARKLSERSWVYSELGLRKWLSRQK